ncbi:MAG: hypothetical protein IJZ00_03345 [Lachnospiraceae bacterium]|nr:hypothetical protein [Lachnospiraceae bacterium]
MKNKARLSNKIYRKIHWLVFDKLKPGKWVRIFYKSYRHRKKGFPEGADRRTVYITQIPNEGAGIGHQMANFNGGYHYSQLFNVPFAYPAFSDKKWEEFLGFGENEISVKELKKQGYKIRKLPYFKETKDDVAMVNRIIDSYAGQKIVLSVELDQFYKKQYDVIPYIKEKFENATARRNDKVLYNEEDLNVAIHIRRGDIVVGRETGEETLTKRWISLDYYENVVKCLKEKYKKEMTLYIFSQGEKEEYSVFEKYGKVIYCLDMDAMQSFLHMVRADILVISKSSFSYKPALLADGIRVCPPDFWHDYPEDEKWIVASEEGIF